MSIPVLRKVLEGGKCVVDETPILPLEYRGHRANTYGGSDIIDDVRRDLAQTR